MSGQVFLPKLWEPCFVLIVSKFVLRRFKSAYAPVKRPCRSIEITNSVVLALQVNLNPRVPRGKSVHYKGTSCELGLLSISKNHIHILLSNEGKKCTLYLQLTRI